MKANRNHLIFSSYCYKYKIEHRLFEFWGLIGIALRVDKEIVTPTPLIRSSSNEIILLLLSKNNIALAYG